MPHLKGEEVFLSLKRNADIVLGSDYESHRPDQMSISRPRIQTRAGHIDDDHTIPSTMILRDSPIPSQREEMLVEVTTPTLPLDCHHVIAVQTTACDPSKWHMARLLKTFAKA